MTNDTTFCVSKFMKTYFQQAYTIRASTKYQDNADVSDFFPVPDFQVPNADVTLISIFTQAKYIDAVNDTVTGQATLDEVHCCSVDQALQACANLASCGKIWFQNLFRNPVAL